MSAVRCGTTWFVNGHIVYELSLLKSMLKRAAYVCSNARYTEWQWICFISQAVADLKMFPNSKSHYVVRKLIWFLLGIKIYFCWLHCAACWAKSKSLNMKAASCSACENSCMTSSAWAFSRKEVPDKQVALWELYFGPFVSQKYHNFMQLQYSISGVLF